MKRKERGARWTRTLRRKRRENVYISVKKILKNNIQDKMKFKYRSHVKDQVLK